MLLIFEHSTLELNHSKSLTFCIVSVFRLKKDMLGINTIGIGGN